MDPDAEITFEFVPVIRQYKSARVERMYKSDHANAARVSVLGFSAGGNVAHNVTLRAGVKGMALLHPYFLSGTKAEGEVKVPWVHAKLEELWTFACGGGTAREPGRRRRAEPAGARVRAGPRLRVRRRAGDPGQGVLRGAAGKRVGEGGRRAAGLRRRGALSSTSTTPRAPRHWSSWKGSSRSSRAARRTACHRPVHSRYVFSHFVLQCHCNVAV
jgi:hypothetical protein